jgi:hypothetical protein
MAKKPRRTSLILEEFTYLPPQSLPRLVLGIHYTRADFRSDIGGPRDYRFHRPRVWERLGHETGGIGQNQHYWLATTLTPTLVAAEGIRQLVRIYQGTSAGAFSAPPLHLLFRYRQDVKAFLGADVDFSHPLFEEGQLPVDVECAQRLTSDKLPPNLDDLIEWDSGMDRAAGSLNRWSLAILHQNSA